MVTDKAKILIVDDEKTYIDILVGLLEKDYEVIIAKNGEKALKRVRIHPPPDLILLDAMMPGLSGYEVCKRLKGNEETKNIPVIFITAITEAIDEAKAFNMGAVDYITKPITPATVLSRVKTHISLNRYREQLEVLVVERTTKMNHALSELKEAEAELKASESQLKTILEANPDPMIVYDLSGYPKYLNPAFTDVFGWSLDEVEDRKIPYIPEDQEQMTSENIKAVFEKGKPLSFETRRLTKFNECIDVLLSAAVNKNDQGESVGIVMNLTDITDKKIIEKQYKQAQKMEAIGTLSGGIAHDFNNILSPIIMGSEMVLNNLSDGSADKGILEQVIQAAIRAKELVQQILNFSRQDDGEKGVIHLTSIVKETMKLIRMSLPASIEINQDIAAKHDVIWGNPVQIHQIIMNLCSNAFHAMKAKGGVLSIRLTNEVHTSAAVDWSFDVLSGYCCAWHRQKP